MKNIAVFASGNGSNFQAILNAAQKGKIPADIKLLVCDNTEAYVLKRAQRAKIKAFIVDRRDFLNRKGLEEQILKKLRAEKIDLIALAGFMRILSADFVRRYKNKILNIHPALLPSFKGADAIKDAFRYGVKITGVTVHFVDEEMDHGPIILQEAVKISKGDSLEVLEKRIHRLEHRIYPQAIKLLLENKLCLQGRNVTII